MTGENGIINAEAELAKARTARRAAQALAEIGIYDDASSRLYYATFHLVSAALLVLGVQAESHGGLASLLGQHLVRPGLIPAQVARDFASLMSLRSQADYNRHFFMDSEGYAEAHQKADALFASLGRFLAERGIEG